MRPFAAAPAARKDFNVSRDHPAILVVGSINMDLVVRTVTIPRAGETVLGRDFATIPGGKGANQAVAAARLGGRVAMIGRVGDDDLGPRLRAGLQGDGIDVASVLTTPGVPSGIAVIVVSDRGENAITVASGANFRLTPADLDAAEPLFRAAKVCLLQLEIPADTVLHALELCRRHGVESILDTAPAPRPPAPAGLFAADIVSPNQGEAAALLADGAAQVSDDPSAVADALHARGCAAVVLKLGEQGAYLSGPKARALVPGHRVEVVDTTAAGDAFTGALAVGRARGLELRESVELANAAGALACARLGAQPSMPSVEEVARLRAGTG